MTHPGIRRNSDGLSIDGVLHAELLRALGDEGPIERLSIRSTSLLTAKLAFNLRQVVALRDLWLWTDATPAAMRDVLRIPQLRTLDVLGIRPPGSLPGFGVASSLTCVRANCHLRRRDVLAIAECPTLTEIGLQGAAIDATTIDAFLRIDGLRNLDLEGTGFDDALADRLSMSATLEKLEIGATRITRTGLFSLVRMKQLRGLDLWATNLSEAELQLLLELPQLEYLSVGGVDGCSLSGSAIVELVLALPALKRVWLDGIALSPAQRSLLAANVASVRISP